jgi:Tat protein secretion system quality control protein TatD with DNase activity
LFKEKGFKGKKPLLVYFFIPVSQKEDKIWYYSLHMKQYAFFDLHSHLHDTAYHHDKDEVIAEMKSYGVGSITVGTDIALSKEAVALAEKHDNLYATVGLHPVDNVTEEFDEQAFEALLLSKKVVGIGECGLDYHYIENFFERDKEEKGLVHDREEAAK